MSIAALVRTLSAAGATPEVIALAVEAVEAEQGKESARKAKRAEQKAAERARKKDMSRDCRATVAALSQTVADTPVPLDKAPPHPPKTQPLTPLEPNGSDDERTRAREPHRLPRDFSLCETDRQFAREQGWTDAEVDDGFAEFVDYWSNPKLPASKALKQDWSATWRNRVRDMGKRRGTRPANGHAYWPRSPPERRPSAQSVAIRRHEEALRQSREDEQNQSEQPLLASLRQ